MTRNYWKVWQVLQSVTDKFYKVRRNSGILSGLKFSFAKCLFFLKTEVILANFYLSGKLPVLKVSLNKTWAFFWKLLLKYYFEYQLSLNLKVH